MSGLNKFEGKDKRRQRMRNKYVRDLRSPKYGQRVGPSKQDREQEELDQEYRMMKDYIAEDGGTS